MFFLMLVIGLIIYHIVADISILGKGSFSYVTTRVTANRKTL